MGIINRLVPTQCLYCIKHQPMFTNLSHDSIHYSSSNISDDLPTMLQSPTFIQHSHVSMSTPTNTYHTADCNLPMYNNIDSASHTNTHTQTSTLHQPDNFNIKTTSRKHTRRSTACHPIIESSSTSTTTPAPTPAPSLKSVLLSMTDLPVQQKTRQMLLASLATSQTQNGAKYRSKTLNALKQHEQLIDQLMTQAFGNNELQSQPPQSMINMNNSVNHNSVTSVDDDVHNNDGADHVMSSVVSAESIPRRAAQRRKLSVVIDKQSYNTNNNVLHKSHTCTWSGCNKSFHKLSSLTRHMRVHTGDRPYECHLCPLTFNEKGNLSRHLRIHDNQREYKCEIHGCTSAFLRRSQLIQHLSKQHDIDVSHVSARVPAKSGHELLHAAVQPAMKSDYSNIMKNEISDVSERVRKLSTTEHDAQQLMKWLNLLSEMTHSTELDSSSSSQSIQYSHDSLALNLSSDQIVHKRQRTYNSEISLLSDIDRLSIDTTQQYNTNNVQLLSNPIFTVGELFYSDDPIQQTTSDRSATDNSNIHTMNIHLPPTIQVVSSDIQINCMLLDSNISPLSIHQPLFLPHTPVNANTLSSFVQSPLFQQISPFIITQHHNTPPLNNLYSWRDAL